MPYLLMILVLTFISPASAVSPLNARKLQMLDDVLNRNLSASRFTNAMRSSPSDAEFLMGYADRLLQVPGPWTSKRHDVRNQVTSVLRDLRFPSEANPVFTLERESPEAESLAAKLILVFDALPPRADLKPILAYSIAQLGGWRIKDMPKLLPYTLHDQDQEFANYVAEGVANGDEALKEEVRAWAKNHQSETLYTALLRSGLIKDYKEVLHYRIKYGHTITPNWEGKAYQSPLDAPFQKLLREKDEAFTATFLEMQSAIRNSKAKYNGDVRKAQLEWMREFWARAIPEFAEEKNVVPLRPQSCNESLQ